MKGFISIILDPTRFCPDYGVVDLEKQILVCRSTCEREADRVADALNEVADRRARGPVGLLTSGKGDQ